MNRFAIRQQNDAKIPSSSLLNLSPQLDSSIFLNRPAQWL
jgi:hypothetical protein